MDRAAAVYGDRTGGDIADHDVGMDNGYYRQHANAYDLHLSLGSKRELL